MADSDVPRSSLRFPRRRLRRASGGYRSGRPCAAAAPAGEAVVRSRTVALGGQPVVVRAAGPADAAEARAMHARCSSRTLTLRYHGPVTDADRYLAHLLDPRHGVSLVAEDGQGRVVGLAHLLWDGEETEVALLVEDAWQRHGVGRALLRALIEQAVAARREVVYAVTQASNAGMIALMRGTGLAVDHRVEEGALVLSARVTAPGAHALPAHAGW
ncbi:GNAT family N-acetyltransferase [Streptomyces boetiae]|uniref:GNAT family N-acetyltransferase n=1 Tax=Streptomyces boetiae TaxID=3075541 RepID=UPI00374E058E